MRKPRQKQTGATYHLIARSNRQEFIFEKDCIKDLFLNVIKRAKDKYRFKLINFCIMSNHVHLIIRPHPKEDISKIMQWILSVFAIIFNKIHGYKGHVWYDRFKSIIIDSLKQFVSVYNYITNNPVKSGIVKKAEEYKYTGTTFIQNKDFSIVDYPNTFL